MKSCELCKSPARIYCDSDQASLCWTCDTKVHSANFLVARHSRTLLCRNCQSPTPWSASGESLGPSAISVCQKCFVNDADESVASEKDDDVIEDDDDVIDDEDEGDEDDDDDVYEGEDDDEDGDDNQVVPWCNTPPPPESSSGSDDDECFNGDDNGYMKRKRDNVPDLSSEDDEIECSSARKSRRETTLCNCSPSSSESIVEKMKIFRQISGENESGEVVVGECKATRAVGFDLNL